MEDEIDRGARKRRDKLAAEEKARKGHRLRAAADRTRDAKARRIDALAGALGARVAYALGVFGFGVVLFETAIALAIREPTGIWRVAAYGFAAVAMFVSAYGGFFGARRLVGALRLVALRRHPHLDCVRYVTQLGERWSAPVVHARVTFRQAWPESRRTEAETALHEWLPKLDRIAWSDERLEIVTTPIATSDVSGFRTGGGEFSYSNRNVHDEAKRILRRAVPALAARVPIERVELEITGDPYVDPEL